MSLGAAVIRLRASPKEQGDVDPAVAVAWLEVELGCLVQKLGIKDNASVGLVWNLDNACS